jgi:hypothetical protein
VGSIPITRSNFKNLPGKMTKSKTFWAAAAVLSLAAALYSAYSVYGRVSLHFSGDTIVLRDSAVPPPVPAAAEAEEEEKAQEQAAESPAPEAQKAAAGPRDGAQPEKAAAKAVRVPFEYKDSKAKSVNLAGTFTAWKEKPMKKKDGAWRAEVYILPGTYPYHFVVDGKKKADPGKPLSPSGDSLVKVAGQ